MGVKKPPKPKKRFSLPFLISIPANFIISLILILTLLDMNITHRIDNLTLALFAFGLISGFGLTLTAKMSKFRVFIHEIKHSTVVNLSGNKVREIKVGKNTGHVEYAMYQDRLHYAPLIALAPYFFPLFSLPVMISAIFLLPIYPQYIIPALGFSLALDLSFSIFEIHPHQTDFQNIIGGFFTSALYLAGFYLMWFLVCSNMALFGLDGFYRAFYIALNLGQRVWIEFHQ